MSNTVQHIRMQGLIRSRRLVDRHQQSWRRK